MENKKQRKVKRKSLFWEGLSTSPKKSPPTRQRSQAKATIIAGSPTNKKKTNKPSATIFSGNTTGKKPKASIEIVNDRKKEMPLKKKSSTVLSFTRRDSIVLESPTKPNRTAVSKPRASFVLDSGVPGVNTKTLTVSNHRNSGIQNKIYGKRASKSSQDMNQSSTASALEELRFKEHERRFGNMNLSASANNRIKSISRGSLRKKRGMSKVEKQELRRSRRVTMQQQKSNIDKKVDQFINVLVSMEETMKKEREEMDDMQKRFLTVANLLSLISTSVEGLKDELDGLVRTFPIGAKDVKKFRPFHQDLLNFQDKFRKSHHQYFVSVAKSTKALQQAAESSQQQQQQQQQKRGSFTSPVASPVRAPAPPPTISSPKLSGGKTITDLLGEIHKGTKLKEVDHERVRNEREKFFKTSLNVASDLHRVLVEAMDARSESLLDSDSEEEDWSDDDDDEKNGS